MNDNIRVSDLTLQQAFDKILISKMEDKDELLKMLKIITGSIIIYEIENKKS